MKFFMQKIFWPLITAVFTIIVLYLWFTNNNKDITTPQISQLTIDGEISLPPEITYDIKGQDVVLHGRVASEEEKLKLIQSFSTLDGVKNVLSELIIMPKTDALSFCVSVDDSGVALTGMLPVELKSDDVMALVERQKQGLPVYDQLSAVTGSFPHYDENINAIIALLPLIEKGQIALYDNVIFVDQDNFEKIHQNKLPEGLDIKLMEHGWDNAQCAFESTKAP